MTLQVVGEQGVVKSEIENGPETVKKQSNSAVTLDRNVMRDA
jgi:hypothetical protein